MTRDDLKAIVWFSLAMLAAILIVVYVLMNPAYADRCTTPLDRTTCVKIQTQVDTYGEWLVRQWVKRVHGCSDAQINHVRRYCKIRK